MTNTKPNKDFIRKLFFFIRKGQSLINMNAKIINNIGKSNQIKCIYYRKQGSLILGNQLNHLINKIKVKNHPIILLDAKESIL